MDEQAVRKARKRRAEFTPDKQKVFLDVLSRGDTVLRAAGEAGVALRTVYNLRDRDEAFRGEWDFSYSIGTQALEQLLIDRIRSGADRKIFSEIREFFILKARDPGRFREAVNIEGTFDVRSVLNLTVLTDREFATFAPLFQKVLASPPQRTNVLSGPSVSESTPKEPVDVEFTASIEHQG